jgi:hypothetical protein
MGISMSWLRRATNFSSGLTCGGGDTGFDVSPQPITLLKRIQGSTPVDVVLPKGSIILDVLIIPDPDFPPLAGTVAIVNATDAAVVLAASPANAYLRTPVAAPVAINAGKKFTITPAVLTPNTAVSVGFTVRLPRPRA